MEYDFSIIDTVFDPNNNQNTIHRSKGEDGKTRYKVWLYVTGNSVPFIDYVIYTLHHTFQNPKIKITRRISNPNCSYSIWTWGIFTVQVEIHLKTGEVLKYDHYMTYDEESKKRDFSFTDSNEPVITRKNPDLIIKPINLLSNQRETS